MTEPAEEYLMTFEEMDKDGPFGAISRWADPDNKTYVHDSEFGDGEDVVSEFVSFFYRAVVHDFEEISAWEVSVLNTHFNEVLNALAQGNNNWSIRAMTRLFGTYKVLLAANREDISTEKE